MVGTVGREGGVAEDVDCSVSLERRKKMGRENKNSTNVRMKSDRRDQRKQ